MSVNNDAYFDLQRDLEKASDAFEHVREQNEALMAERDEMLDQRRQWLLERAELQAEVERLRQEAARSHGIGSEADAAQETNPEASDHHRETGGAFPAVLDVSKTPTPRLDAAVQRANIAALVAAARAVLEHHGRVCGCEAGDALRRALEPFPSEEAGS